MRVLAVLALGLAAPWTVSAATPTAQAFVAAAVQGLDAELRLLDGGNLTKALRDLALGGAPLRVLLDPSLESSRREGARLAALGPTVQVRWLEGSGTPVRRLLSADGHLAWRPGRPPGRSDATLPLARERFARAWERALRAPPEGLLLEDELKGLPDPSEGTPRIIRRREAGAREGKAEHDENDQGQQRPGPGPSPAQP